MTAFELLPRPARFRGSVTASRSKMERLVINIILPFNGSKNRKQRYTRYVVRLSIDCTPNVCTQFLGSSKLRDC